MMIVVRFQCDAFLPPSNMSVKLHHMETCIIFFKRGYFQSGADVFLGLIHLIPRFHSNAQIVLTIACPVVAFCSFNSFHDFILPNFTCKEQLGFLQDNPAFLELLFFERDRERLLVRNNEKIPPFLTC
mmetsp:Transcript_18443/g.40759  ORF Transcript_18443/g.40759 Transcript_18443/m.40759 type:complete len:128 (-) Transcript_18443:413-796(-)